MVTGKSAHAEMATCLFSACKCYRLSFTYTEEEKYSSRCQDEGPAY